MNQITPVVKQLLIINVLVYVTAYFLMPDLKALLPLYYPSFAEFKPFQIITSMFMHFGSMHIIFNMLSLFFLGPMVENQMGSKKFLFFYLFCGFGATAVHLGMTYLGVIPPSVVAGASGAIMGVFAAFAYFFPNLKLMLLFPPIPVKAKYLIIGLMAYDMFIGVSGYNDGIANFAHIGGAVFGFLLLLYWQKFDNTYRIN